MKEFFNSIFPVEDAILEEYLSYWMEYKLEKNKLITAKGNTERYMYFVLEGTQKSYYLHNDKEHIIAFSYPPSFSGIPESFLPQKPSKYFLSTISDSHFLRISYQNHQTMMAKHRDLETFFRKATELLLVQTLDRYFELMAYDIETRFKVFTARSPHLLNMISQKDLSSYLRISPSNFSKLIGSIKI